MKFLVIDDDLEFLNQLLEKMGKNRNVKIARCFDALEAIDIIRGYAPDVLFLDNSLKERDEGVRVAGKIGKNIEIYSTTLVMPFDLGVKYLLAGVPKISWVGKNVENICEIINELS